MGQIVLRSAKTEISVGTQKNNQHTETSISIKHEIPKVNLYPIKKLVFAFGYDAVIRLGLETTSRRAYKQNRKM